MKTTFLFGSVFLAGVALADDKAAAPPAPKAAYAPVNKSSFKADGITRNPFEPIGYVFNAVVKAPDPIPVCTPDMFRVSSIIVGSPGVAVINGRDFAEGDLVPVPDQEVKVKLIKVSDGQIILLHPNPKVGNQGRVVIRNQ